jgi:glucan phosphorylase
VRSIFTGVLSAVVVFPALSPTVVVVFRLAPSPVIVLFAGKAHPQDRPGQDMIRRINEFAAEDDLVGKLFFIEDYDLTLARKLVTGSDVWLNTPQYPLEASGTSGQKAAASCSQ